ncbi:MAG: isoprenyl transferase [Clostridia bacterium]|nr:isoprenyl transferase [Clostridia bacterium]MCI9275386.1 isoprenyl transferase [Clostridia bacterium]
MDNKPEHIAIIMDGNRRWARAQGLNINLGHKEGAENLKRIAIYANNIGIKYLTVYAFSTENWKRSEDEVGALMVLLKTYLNDLISSVDTKNVRIKIFGHIESLPDKLRENIEKAIEKTKDNTGLTLCIAFNYGGRDEITRATRNIAKDVEDKKLSIQDIDEDLFKNYLYTKEEPDPDLLIRTSGEIRLSNFLPWQLVYTEFIFVNKYWPEFTEKDLDEAINTYEKRNRNFGGK